MKKYIFFLLVAIAGLVSFTSCNEQLDLDSDGRITMNDVFNDRFKTMGYLNSCYEYVGTAAPGIAWSSFCDEAEDVDDNIASDYSHWYQGAVTASNFSSISRDGSPWSSLYQGIRKCNIFLSNIEKANIIVSEDERAGWTAQAHTLRALYYLQLIKRYGDVPLLDKPLEVNHDFSKDTKSKFSTVVKFILADCDSALKAPDSRTGFSWNIYENQYQIMSRAVAYAIKSEAVTYAVSKLWNDGSYSYDDATKINEEALSQCLTHDYSLFSMQPANKEAQNAYDLYFITDPNDQRTKDKETIYQSGGRQSVWQNAGVPTTDGVTKAGPCPTQELVDSYEMANGTIPITGYNDDSHLNPIINTASGYDPANPYVGRDPRFYASIYYNGAIKTLQDTYDMSQSSAYNQLTVTNPADGGTKYVTTGTDSHMNLPILAISLKTASSIVFSITYKSSTGISDPQIFLGTPGFSGAKSVLTSAIPATSNWKTYTVDLTSYAKNFGWGSIKDLLRFDLGSKKGKDIQIISMTLTAPVPILTYAGAPEGWVINDALNDHKHTRTGYYMRKFNNYQSTKNSNLDGWIRLFRLSELYLNFAETAYQAKSPDEELSLGSGVTMSARDAVNAIRKRAGMPNIPAGLSSSDFEKRYRNERRIELAFEGHRFFDVRRWKVLSTTDKNVSGMHILQDGSYNRYAFDARNCYSDKWFLYPIDQSEINKEVGKTSVNWQNPGW